MHANLQQLIASREDRIYDMVNCSEYLLEYYREKSEITGLTHSQLIYTDNFGGVRKFLKDDIWVHLGRILLMNPNNLMIDTASIVVKCLAKSIRFIDAVRRATDILGGPFDLRASTTNWCYELYDPAELDIALALGVDPTARVRGTDYTVMACTLLDIVADCEDSPYLEQYNAHIRVEGPTTAYVRVSLSKKQLAIMNQKEQQVITANIANKQRKIDWLLANGVPFDTSLIENLHYDKENIWPKFLKSRGLKQVMVPGSNLYAAMW
jgi:hypothetical protein